MNPASPPAESRIPIRQHWQIALLSALLFSPLLIWVWLDRRYWPWDQADYGFASVYLGQLLLTDPAGWFQAMTSVLGYRAPGLPYLAQCAYVFGDTVGRIGPALLTVVVAMLMLGGAIVGMTVRSLCRLEVSLLAVLLIAAAPVSLAMGQTFLVEAPQMAVVAALCGVMVKSPETPLHRLGLQVMLVGTVAMLFKVTSPVYCAGPGLLIAWIVARRMAESRREKPRHEWVRQDWVWLGVTGVVLFFGLLWYGKNGGTILEFIRLNTVDPAGEIYGSNQGVLRKFFLYWLPSVREGYFLPWVYWAGLAATVTAVLMAWL
ncbi:MAG: hypothetical protein SFY92_03210, partial [Verrucomicrobiae bacterium]|nr:hypothetical protein [Verrucomicrobiae bacterium]